MSSRTVGKTSVLELASTNGSAEYLFDDVDCEANTGAQYGTLVKVKYQVVTRFLSVPS